MNNCVAMENNCIGLILPTGQVAIIDSSNYAKIRDRNWHASGNCSHTTYVGAATNKKHYILHRVLLDAPKGLDVDHINGNGLDNRMSNIRLVTKSQNMWNRKHYSEKKKYKGVFFIKDNVKAPAWSVRLHVNNIKINIGTFYSEDEAARAYDAAALKHYGEYAWLNFPTTLLGEKQ